MDTISISSLNLNNQFVAADVRLRIFKLKEPDRVLRKRLWKTPDQFVMDSLDFKRFFPDDVYRDEDNHLTWDVKKTLLDRSIRTAKKGWVTVPSEVWSENGWYVIEVMTGDKNGRQLTEKKYVQIWSERNEGNINAPLAVIPQTQSKEPGEEAKVYAVSGYGRIHLLQQVRDMSGKTDYTHIDFTGKPVRWEKRIISSDRGGISVNYVTVKENRFYQQQAFITIPWSNKDLNIRWETHRDKLLPGGKETWTMVIQGDKKEKLAAEMVATLYDASLDAFRPHKWNIYGLFPSLAGYGNGNAPGFGPYEGRQIGFIKTEPVAAYQKRYAWLYLRELSGTPSLQTAIRRGGMLNDATAKFYNSPLAETASAVQAKEDAFSDIGFTPPIAETSVEAQANAGIQKEFPVRKNLRETAFFFPHLRTDREGNVRMEFNMPEALTEWKLMTFAHTRDMSYGMMEGSVKTQKDLMITPNLPRFLRQGDEMTVSARISNLGDNSLNGIATLELLDATTMQPVHLAFRLEQKEQKFTAAKGQSTMASWKLHIPESTYEPVVIRVLAQSGSFTDGEEHIIPVVTNRMLVTETLPLWINGNGTKTFSFDKLRHSDTGRSLVHHALTVEYSGNPAWYAVQSLPYLMEYPYECAEQTFNRYYATALAAHIVQQSPRIKAIFDKWKEQAVFSSSSSPLENNQELKSALLEETPWVMEAKTETEQRKRLGQLFDAYRLSRDMDAAIRKLYDMQLPEGGFSWFKGMRSNRFITQYIITGLGRLQQLGVKDNSGSMQQIIKKALPYLDRQMKESYDLLVRDKARLDQQHISYPEIQYLYMRSFFKPSVESGARIAYRYYLSQAAKYWPDFNPYMKGMIALALYRNNDKETPEAIIQSLKETALNNEETGMYWMQRGQSYWWYAAPIEAQSLLVECFNEVVNDRASVDAMKIWLLKTQSWETTRATADACYALLLSGTDWLKNEPKVVLELGDMTMNSTQQVQDAGSGYFKVRYAGKLVKSDAGNIRLNVTGNANSTSWGAVYWQYFEDIDKISSAATPLKIKKQLFIERNTDRGPELYPVNPNNALHIGDKIKVRIEIIVDRDMEYVHLKDMRAAAFEPVNVISAYKWQGGLGYYESTKDLSTSFFFDYLRKGKYVFEYPVFVQQTGNFSAGIATIQCMYAPEFSGHSDGIRIAVTAD